MITIVCNATIEETRKELEEQIKEVSVREHVKKLAFLAGHSTKGGGV